MKNDRSVDKTALLIGAVRGKAAMTDKNLVGLLLHYFDSGATVLHISKLVVSTGVMDQLAGSTDTIAYVALIYQAVTGQVATNEVLAGLTPYTDDGGSHSKAVFLAAVAEQPIQH